MERGSVHRTSGLGRLSVTARLAILRCDGPLSGRDLQYSASHSRSPLTARAHLPLLLLLITTLSVAVRWAQLPTAMALGDTLGPWLVAYRGPWGTAPHAPPYGWMLAVPHSVILPFCHDLYSAFAGIRVVDALVAPLGAWAAHRTTGRFGSTAAVGILLALDSSLLDTATSGAETYQAPVAIALLTLATTMRTPAAGWVGGLAFCWAVMCHPLAVCAAPLLFCVRWTPLPALAASAVLLPHLVELIAHAPGVAVAPMQFPSAALSAWATQSGGAALVFGGALLFALRRPSTRKSAQATLASLGLLLLAGAQLGYLRDHHVRMWSAPAALGLATLPGPVALVAVASAVSMPPNTQRRGAHRRPGTLGLLHLTTTTIKANWNGPQALVVDGIRTVSTPAVEPGGIWLDLLLRGVDPTKLDITDDAQVAILVTAARRAPELQTCRDHGLRSLASQDTWAICLGAQEQVRAWSVAMCPQPEGVHSDTLRVGGAWDGLALIHPERGAAAVTPWWTCSPG